MNTNGNNYDFLKEIKSENLSKAKANFQFQFNKYTTLYVVDTFDIIEFCFPLIFSSANHTISALNISNYLAYEFFFSEYPNKHILLEEYKIELYSFWYKAQQNIRGFSNYENLKNGMIADYNSISENEDKIRFIESNISILLAIAFGALSKTPFDRFNNLVNEELQIESIHVVNSDDDKTLDDIFFSTDPNINLVNQAFDFFCEKTKKSLCRLKEDVLANYLEGVYRDIKVYDRIVNINKKLSLAEADGKLSRKYNVLYLSSVTKKTEIIESFYRDYLPTYEGIITDSLHRNNIEVYIHQLLNIGESDKQKALTIELLNTLENISKSYETNAGKIQKYKELFSDNFENVNSKMLNSGKDIDEIFLKYHSISDHRKKIDKAINLLRSTGNEIDLLKQFTDILDRASSQENQSALIQLEESLANYNSLMETKSNIVSNINYLNKNKGELKLQLRESMDSVKSSIQAFPILLFYKKKSIVEIQKLFKHIIDPGNKKTTILLRLINTPNQLLYEFSTYEKKIFFLFIRYLFDASLAEKKLLDELDEFIELNKKHRIDTQFFEGKNLTVHFTENTNLKIELLYFKTWVLRRNNDYDKAIEIINEQVDVENKLDVRLYHSRGLCYKSRYYKQSSIESVPVLTGYLEKALDDFCFCENEYSIIEEQKQYPVLIQDTVFVLL